MNNSFLKTEHLRQKKDFNNVFYNGKKFVNKYFVIYYITNHLDNSRIGIAVKKKVAKSNKRNRIIRLIKEYYRLNKFKFNDNFDFLFIVRYKFDLYDYKSLSHNLDKLLFSCFKKVKNLETIESH